MKRGDVNWEKFGKELLWRNIVYEKNGDSGYDIMLENEEIGRWRFSSIITPSTYKLLTWKELALALGLFEEYLTPDGHDCKICSLRKDCSAYFKDDEDHERCYLWEGLMDKNLKTEDGKIYDDEGNEVNYETD